MADKRWVSTNGNLNDAASYSPSGVPIAGDSWFLDGTSRVDVISNLNAFAAFDMTRIWVQSPYDGNIGANGNPLIAQVRWLIHNGSGSLFYAYEAHASTTYVVIDSPNQQDAFTLASAGVAGLGMTICAIDGHVELLDSAMSIGRMLISSKGHFNLPTVNIGVINGILNYRQESGFVTTKTPFGNASTPCIIDSGTLIYDAAGTALWPWMEITGGYVQFNGTPAAGSAMTTCVVSAGTLDMNQDSRAKTIDLLILFPGANFLTHKNITVTQLLDLRPDYPILP